MSDADATNPPAATEAKPEAVEEQKPAEEKPAEETGKTEEQEKTESETKAEDKKEEDANDDKKILKTKGQIDYDNPQNNRKFDPTARGVTDDPNAIRKQVEFYFGDWNFPQDKFMWETAGGTENNPIPIAKIHSFKRMRSFQPYSAVVAALRDSSMLEVGGEEGEETVKRKHAYKLQSHNKAKVDAATVYAKGFGDETPTTQFDLEGFFAKFGEVKAVKLRRTDEGFFKGSVFVTFSDEETAKKFVETDPAPQWEGHDLKIMSKRAYCEEKSDLIRQGKLEPNGPNPKKFYEGRGGQAPRDKDNWRERRDYDQKNGFRGGRGGGRGRGNRGGRGRGGRGGRGGRDRDDNRRRDRNEEREQNGKRSRDEDGGADEPAAKKVDTKEAPAAAPES